MPDRRLFLLALLFALPLGGWQPNPAAAANPAQQNAEADKTSSGADQAAGEQFFTAKVQPLLVARCYKCHHGDKSKGSLRLDSLAHILTGGDSGPALVPGKPGESLLIEAVNYESYEMPPDGQLPDEEIAVLAEWVKLGAPWPGADPTQVAPAKPRPLFTEEDRQWWAFQPLSHPTPPATEDPWVRNEIDQFVLARMKSIGLGPADEADRPTLIRRLYFDLIGVPPTPAEVDAFVADASSKAYENLVDRLLEDPRYGERQARHWLDLVRYAESEGFRRDAYRPNAWKYRDWVIQALNEDMPYDEFVTQQLAGDEMSSDDPQAIVATGYYRLGLYEWNQRDARTQQRDMYNDITDTTGDVFLGLGFGCAKCHDHKFDPILQRDYFRLQAFFEPMIFDDQAPVATQDQLAEYQRKLAAWEQKAGELLDKIDAIETKYGVGKSSGTVKMFPADVQAIYNKPRAERDSHEAKIVDLVQRQVDEKAKSAEKAIKGDDLEKWKALKEQLAKFNDEKPAPLARVPGVKNYDGEIATTEVPSKRKPEPVAPGFMTLLEPEPADLDPAKPDGRRLALARWITRPDNPLSTRVIVNRLWQYHFGEGLVATPSDFGQLGEPPSHPQLLDWLAERFVADGWSMKSMHRLMVTSATYRQTSLREAPPVAAKEDPSGRLLWRMRVRRLQAEQIRDAMLAVSGDLDSKMGGPSQSGSGSRRSIYVKTMRNSPDPLLAIFDLPEAAASLAVRNMTTTPMQSLMMINGDWTLKRSKSLASDLMKEDPPTPRALVELAYRRVLARKPTSVELDWAVDFLKPPRATAPEATEEKGWIAAFPGREGTAVEVQSSGTPSRLRVEAGSALPSGDFTIEAFVLLRSMYEDATVRTIASHWDSNTSHPGWALGVTSKRSKYTPRNLILQMVGDPGKGGAGYEVIPSGLHLELGQPYYVAATVNLKDTSKQGITFYLKKLVGDSQLETAQVPHKVTDHYHSDLAFVIGGRDHRETRHRWDGLLDDVRLTGAALEPEQLLIHGDSKPESCVGFWRFEAKPDALANSYGPAPAILPPGVVEPSSREMTSAIDLCHVLLNSNEFLYVD